MEPRTVSGSSQLYGLAAQKTSCGFMIHPADGVKPSEEMYREMGETLGELLRHTQSKENKRLKKQSLQQDQ